MLLHMLLMYIVTTCDGYLVYKFKGSLFGVNVADVTKIMLFPNKLLTRGKHYYRLCIRKHWFNGIIITCTVHVHVALCSCILFFIDKKLS